jgi:hypothetical protein
MRSHVLGMANCRNGIDLRVHGIQRNSTSHIKKIRSNVPVQPRPVSWVAKYNTIRVPDVAPLGVDGRVLNSQAV